MQAEAARFLAALRRQADAKGTALFKVSDLFSTADSLELAVPDMQTFIEELNEAGAVHKQRDCMLMQLPICLFGRKSRGLDSILVCIQ